MGQFFLYSSAVAFVMASVLIVTMIIALVMLVRGLLPMVDEARSDVQDLGDLASNTVGRASDTMDLVEMRVSQTMTDASAGGQEVRNRGVGIASAVAGIYLTVKMAGTIRSLWRGEKRTGEKRKGDKSASKSRSRKQKGGAFSPWQRIAGLFGGGDESTNTKPTA